MKKNISINYKLLFYFYTILIISCSKINTNNHSSFDDDGKLIEKYQNSLITEPTSIKIFIEASGSMNGFLRGVNATSFKTDVWELISELRDKSDTILLFSDAAANIQKLEINRFKRSLNSGSLVSGNSTDVPSMLNEIIKQIDHSKCEVGLLISDLKYSPVGLGTSAVLMQQYTTDINNIFKGKKYSVALVGLSSDFLSTNGSVVCNKSPYYLFIVGKEDKIKWVRNKIYKDLQTKIVGISEFGMKYNTPLYSILPIKERSGVISNLSKEPSYCLTEYDKVDKSIFWVAINTQHLPVGANIKDLIICKPVYGSKVVILDKKDTLEVEATDDAVIKKIGATFFVKIELTNMTSDSEVIELSISNYKNQNAWLLPFFGATIESDCTKTLSIDGLAKGIEKALQNSDMCEKPMKIIVSKNQIKNIKL